MENDVFQPSGGKLYVTEPDERSGSKRGLFCGLLGCVLLLVVIVVAILIGGAFYVVLDKGHRFQVGVISPRKLPDDDGGGYPEGAVFDVFRGEVRQADNPNEPPRQLRMINLTWSEEMRNNTSPAFFSLSTRMEKEINEVFKDFPANMTTVVTELLPGSVIDINRK